jgi:hypothetical protein
MFHGKVGMRPIARQIPAQRLSKSWPSANKHVLIQQYNATPHITPAEFRVLWLEKKVELQNRHGGGLDWDLRLYFQPANNPDANINDLGFFVFIQALRFQHPSANIGELIARVLQLYIRRTRMRNSTMFF